MLRKLYNYFTVNQILKNETSEVFVFSTKIILQYKKHLTNTTSNIETTYHRWLLTFSFALLFPVLTFLVYAFALSGLSCC